MHIIKAKFHFLVKLVHFDVTFVQSRLSWDGVKNLFSSTKRWNDESGYTMKKLAKQNYLFYVYV